MDCGSDCWPPGSAACPHWVAGWRPLIKADEMFAAPVSPTCDGTFLFGV